MICDEARVGCPPTDLTPASPTLAESQQTGERVYAELNTIKQTLQKLEQEIDRLTALVVADNKVTKEADFLSIVGLGASGSTDVSEQHDRCVGNAIADEHLR
jgi:hypothetical protein